MREFSSSSTLLPPGSSSPPPFFSSSLSSKHYFIVSEPFEKKTEEDNRSSTDTDPRAIKRRPRRLLSDDGEKVFNIWMVPMYREVLMLFRTLDDKRCTESLRRSLAILAPFHDILHYLMAHARLGTSAARLGTGAAQEFVTTDWGGTEGVGKCFPGGLAGFNTVIHTPSAFYSEQRS